MYEGIVSQTEEITMPVLVGENLTYQNLLPVASSPRPLINSCADGGVARGKRKKGLVNGKMTTLSSLHVLSKR